MPLRSSTLNCWSRRLPPARLVRLSDLDRTLGRLGDADLVAERVAQRAVDAVWLLGRVLGELRALAGELLVGLAAVIGAEDAGQSERPLGEQVAHLAADLF